MPTIKSINEYVTKIYPKLIYTTKVIKQILCMLSTKHAQSKEFMFLGTVEKTDEVYTIKDVFLIPQTNCTATYCETDDSAYPEWLNENFTNIEERKTIRLHGHSHVNMGTSPSGTDDKQIMDLCNNVNNYFIQLIVNHRLENTCNIWDKEKGLIFNNIDQYIVINNELLEFTSKNKIRHIMKQIPDGLYTIKDNMIVLPNQLYNLVTQEEILQDENITIKISSTSDIQLTNEKDPLLDKTEKESEKLIKEAKQQSYNHSMYDFDFYDFNLGHPLIEDTVTVKRSNNRGKEKTIPLTKFYMPYGEVTLYEVVSKEFKVTKLKFNGKEYSYKELPEDDPLKDNYEDNIVQIKDRNTNELLVLPEEDYFDMYYQDPKFEYIGTWCGLVNQFIPDWSNEIWI